MVVPLHTPAQSGTRHVTRVVPPQHVAEQSFDAEPLHTPAQSFVEDPLHTSTIHWSTGASRCTTTTMASTIQRS